VSPCRNRLPDDLANDLLVAELQDEHAEGNTVGLNLTTGHAMDPVQEGVYDSFRVLRSCIASSCGIASNLLLCDEMLKARQMVSLGAFVSHATVNRSNSIDAGTASRAWARCGECGVDGARSVKRKWKWKRKRKRQALSLIHACSTAHNRTWTLMQLVEINSPRITSQRVGERESAVVPNPPPQIENLLPPVNRIAPQARIPFLLSSSGFGMAVRKSAWL